MKWKNCKKYPLLHQRRNHHNSLKNLQLWTNFLGTVMKYSHFSVASGSSLIKQCILFEISLQFSPPPRPTYTKLKLGKNSGYMRPTFFCGVRAEDGSAQWIGKHPRNSKVSRVFLLMIVGCSWVFFFLATNWEWAISASMEVRLQAGNMNLRGTYMHMKVRFQCRRTSNLDAPSLFFEGIIILLNQLQFETVT